MSAPTNERRPGQGSGAVEIHRPGEIDTKHTAPVRHGCCACCPRAFAPDCSDRCIFAMAVA
jgi:hypothetical protein